MPAARSPAPIIDITAARLRKMDAAVLAAEQALQAARDRRDAYCRQWGELNGYKVRLDADQVRRALAVKGERP
jgi:hypothetical protein